MTGGVSMCAETSTQEKRYITRVYGGARPQGLNAEQDCRGRRVKGALAVGPRPSERPSSPPGGGLRLFQLHVGRRRVASGSGEPPCPFLEG